MKSTTFFFPGCLKMFRNINLTTVFLTGFIKMFRKNVLHTKILQMLGGVNCGSDYVTNHIKESMNNVKYTHDEIDYPTLLYVVSEYSIKLTNVEPINAGMVSLVYSGVDASDNEVIIKIKRNNIYDRIAYDFKQIKSLITILDRLSFVFSSIIPIIDKIRSIVETEDYVLSQCNFTQEITAMKSIKQVIDKYSDCTTIPICYNKTKDIDSDCINFILMDKITGTECLLVPDEDNEILCGLISKFTFTTMCHSEYYHMDLHPGNILLLDNNGIKKLGVIDFGMNLKPSENIKSFERFCSNRMLGRADECDVLDIFKFSFAQPLEINNLTIEEKEQLTEIANSFITCSVNGKIDESIIHTHLRKCKIILKNCNLTLSLEFVKFSMGLSMMLSSLKTLINDPVKMTVIMKKSLSEVSMY